MPDHNELHQNDRHGHNCKSCCKHCKCGHHGGSFVKGVVWGTVIGGILGVLFAPQKGEETRKQLTKTAKKYQQKGEEAAQTAKIKYTEYKGKAEPYIQEAKEKISEIEKTIEKEKGPVLDKIEDFADSLEHEAKEIKKKYFKGLRKR